jgi:pSer/pThr/pTyr-binding forkhead associated (FHA) protein
MYHTIGRSMKRMVQIKLKAVSADHAKIGYNADKGWFITEQGKDKLSSNGTFVFMKSLKQIAEHEPSDLIPLHDGMVISFINYELRVNLEKKDDSVIKEQEAYLTQKHSELAAMN